MTANTKQPAPTKPAPDPEAASNPAITIQSAAQSMVGKPEVEALVIARKGGFWLRVSKRDGVGLPGIADARNDRINATVENGIITRTSVG